MDNKLIITYITHACIKINAKFGGLITDPWILNEPVYAFTTWKYPAAIMSPDEVIKDVDYLFLSHPHEDHLHIPSLNHFPRNLKILLPEYADYPSLRAQTVERTFREMGFHNITKVMPFQTIHLDDDTNFTLVPAARAKYWDWENSGFVLEHQGRKILNMNDCPSDAEVYKKVDELFGEIDLGFVQYAGVSMFPGCFRMSMDEIRAASTKRKHSWTQQKNMIEMLRIKKIAPFAGDFAWLDESLYHCNWSNRATPELFEDFVQTNYPEKNIDVVIMYPSDTWTFDGGLVRNHPEIDWNKYLDAIDKVRDKFKDKVVRLREWLDGAPLNDLQKRTVSYLAHTSKWLPNWNLDFNVNVKVCIEGPNSDFDFYMCSSPEAGFHFEWKYDGQYDQTLYIREKLWAAVLDARVLLTNIQWAAQQEEHVPFRIEIARFWFWFENHVDLNNRNVQALIDNALHPELEERMRPKLGVFNINNEWDKSWLQDDAETSLDTAV
jgi:L-ascorbate metabolism protein UlaG (beta-lactamase superfamily)